ncbi:hypothetical protein HUN08_13265 [Gordonia sp. X0973]|uniref:hypothetical protein n=1 Tax=Gordonia sp. X0973 TaxID=2742602 RepID=UPI000F529815|nr:hypothetical protein [Gordonia sp. X0973]QKT08045.1 hypothetical protein HUN08_13265 [Gordonia sp. X0973]
MGDIDLDQQFVNEWLNGPECERILGDVADEVADYWAAHARRRTGNMATNTIATTVMTASGWNGYFEVLPYYAKFQERGTHDVEAMHLIEEIVALIEGGL